MGTMFSEIANTNFKLLESFKNHDLVKQDITNQEEFNQHILNELGLSDAPKLDSDETKKAPAEKEFQDKINDARDPLARRICEGEDSVTAFLNNTGPVGLAELIHRYEPSKLVATLEK